MFFADARTKRYGVRRRELLHLFDSIPHLTRTLVLKCIPADTLASTNLAHIQAADFPPEIRKFSLQSATVANLLTLSPAVTIRPPRDNKTNGVDYRFVSDQEFTNLAKTGRILRTRFHEGEIFTRLL